MKLTIQLSNLKKAVNVVNKAIPSRSTLSILENLFIQLTENNMVVIRGNDLELGIEYKIPVTVDELSDRTTLLIPSNMLTNILSKMNMDSISLEFKEMNIAQLRANKIDFDIYGISGNDYPQFPDVEKDIQFSIPSNDLLMLIKSTIFSVSHDETKQFLNGIKIDYSQGRCDFISTDGFRLSLKTVDLNQVMPDFSCIIPSKTMNELYKILSGMKEDRVMIDVSQRQICFQVGECTIISRLINGRFPDYKQVLPKNNLFEYKVSRQALLRATERASIIAIQSNYVSKFMFTTSEISIFCTSQQLGDYSETIDCHQQLGEREIQVSFNIRLLQDVLKIMDQQDVIIQLNSELSPCVIQGDGDLTYTHILMPIRMSDVPDVKTDDQTAVDSEEQESPTAMA